MLVLVNDTEKNINYTFSETVVPSTSSNCPFMNTAILMPSCSHLLSKIHESEGLLAVLCGLWSPQPEFFSELGGLPEHFTDPSGNFHAWG